MVLQCGDNQIPEFPFGIAVDKRGNNLIAAIINALIAASAAVTDAQARVRRQVANAGDCPIECPDKTEGDPAFDLARFQVAFDAVRGQWRCAITGTVTAIVTCEPPEVKPDVEG